MTLLTDNRESWVFADYNRLKQVFINIVDNAIKFTAGRPKAEIKISSQVLDDQIVMIIEDNGSGISRCQRCAQFMRNRRNEFIFCLICTGNFLGHHVHRIYKLSNFIIMIFDSCHFIVSLIILVNDLLDFSKLQAHRIELKKTEFSIKQLLTDVHNQFVIRCHQEKIKMTFPCTASITYKKPTLILKVLL